MYRLISIGLFFLLILCQCKDKDRKTPEIPTTIRNVDFPIIDKTIFIDSVWAANMVSFDLYTLGNKQFVAYYDKNRMMTVATRDTSSNQWEKKTLPSKLAWDSHNYVVLGFDEKGFIHVSGNMHGVPLVYFKSDHPFDIHSIKEENYMVGDDEDKVTYPNFLNDKDGYLYYLYRTGGSGSGNNWVNKYNTQTHKWERYIKTNLFEGISANESRSAYYSLKKGSDGYFHCTWVWRWTPLVETTHQLCYAKSKDLLHWENAFGETVDLPHKPDNEKLIVDDAPTRGGMHNGKYQLYLTKDDKPLIGYLKYDQEGFTQLFVANIQNGKWVCKEISNWDFRWKFNGGGDEMTFGAKFSLLPDMANEDVLIINWSNETGKKGSYAINTKTLEHTKEFSGAKEKYPKNLNDSFSKNSKLYVNIRNGKTKNIEDKNEYVLKWESMGKSHGGHAPKVIPDGPLSPLYLIQIK